MVCASREPRAMPTALLTHPSDHVIATAMPPGKPDVPPDEAESPDGDEDEGSPS